MWWVLEDIEAGKDGVELSRVSRAECCTGYGIYICRRSRQLHHCGGLQHQEIKEAERFMSPLSICRRSVCCKGADALKVADTIAQVELQVPVHPRKFYGLVDIKLKAEKLDHLHLAEFVVVDP